MSRGLAILSLAACGHTPEAAKPSRCLLASPPAQPLFLGTVECMKELPTKEMRGFGRLSYESSTFFRLLDDAQSESVDAERAVQLVNDPHETPELRKAWPEKKPRIFSIRFIGAESYAPGLYGSGKGVGAVLVRKVIELQEVQH